jgi:uncharacterized protein
VSAASGARREDELRRGVSDADVTRFEAEEFAPRYRWMRNAHLHTIAGNYWRRRSALPAAESDEIAVAPLREHWPAGSVVCECHWQAEDVRAERLTVLLLHGLGGSAHSRYIVGNANKAWRAGYNVIRMNMRGCGGVEAKAPTIYHCGLADDVRRVLEFYAEKYGLQRVAAVGYSMGGNLVLNYVGEEGADAPEWLMGCAAVSPSIDLDACSAALHERRNRMYEWKFLRSLRKSYARKVERFPEYFAKDSARKARSLREFDTRVVARYAGFDDAEDYYARTSAANVIARIAVPTLVIHAEDDPFIRLTEETRGQLLANSWIRLVETEHGGHCAFMARPESSAYDGYWAERTLLRFLTMAAQAD